MLDYRYLEDPWERLRQAARLCVGLLEHPSHRPLIKEMVSIFPRNLGSDEALDNCLMENLTSVIHLS